MKKHDKAKALADLATKIERCQKCPLYKMANHAVPGAGNPNAEIMFVGEGPGRNEDETGLPLVGTAGKFLDQLLESISAIHGQPKRKNGQVILPMYHPAAALYRGELKAIMLKDFKKIPKTLALIRAE